MMYKFYALLITVGLMATPAKSQVITVENPSFEDEIGHSKVPSSWVNCGSPYESPPDVHPDFTFQVVMEPYDGDTYLGLVTRDNETWEAVGTQLSAVLEKDKCYGFQLALAQSSAYFSVSRAKNTPANYVSPVRLLIWGSNDGCSRDELLAETEVINHYDWKRYSFSVKPLKASYGRIVFEVFYPENTWVPTNGNLLLDGMSSIVPLADCQGVVQPSDLPEFQAADTPVVLELPSEELFESQRKPLRQYLEKTLSAIEFRNKGGVFQLAIDQYRLAMRRRYVMAVQAYTPFKTP